MGEFLAFCVMVGTSWQAKEAVVEDRPGAAVLWLLGLTAAALALLVAHELGW